MIKMEGCDLIAFKPDPASWRSVEAIVTSKSSAKAGLPACILGSALKTRLTLPLYRRLLSTPTWGFATEALVRTRSYERGLDVCLTLLRFTDEHLAELSQKEVESNRRWLFYFLLNLLDKLDQWEDYLSVWRCLQERTNLAIPYSREAREYHGDRIEPFVLGEDRFTLYVHFLYPVMWRKEVIERKVARKKTGRKLGNQFHHPPGELSEAEVRRRLGWILRMAKDATTDRRRS